MNRNKVYVDVEAHFSAEGHMVPRAVIWEDGRRYVIDRIVQIERCASQKAGGRGVRYTCMINGQRSYLFYEVDKWFVERNSA